MSLIHELQNIGLSDKEAKTYLTALELGGASVLEIAGKANLNRTTTYVILNALLRKGLCSTYERGKKTYYVASSPDVLESIFELQKKDIEERKKNFKNLLPQLEALNKHAEGRPLVSSYEGKSGILRAYEEFYKVYIKKDENVRMFYPKDRLNQLFDKEGMEKYRDTRLQKKVHSKVIYTFKDGVLENTPDGERVKVSAEEFPITCDIAIYADRIFISSLGEKLSAILIEDKEIADTLKGLFDFAWKCLKKNARGVFDAKKEKNRLKIS